MIQWDSIRFNGIHLGFQWCVCVMIYGDVMGLMVINYGDIPFGNFTVCELEMCCPEWVNQCRPSFNYHLFLWAIASILNC